MRPTPARKQAQLPTSSTSRSDAISVPGVVVHLDEDGQDKHLAVLRNIDHLLDEVEGTTDVELVVHGAGIHAVLTGTANGELLRALLARGVRIAACERTLARMGVDRAELTDGVGTVPSGIGELVRLQSWGWVYIRP